MVSCLENCASLDYVKENQAYALVVVSLNSCSNAK